ncbi:SRPBCC family protein [Paenibacillus radicis (ex Xue et al. 2023)]|uniref:SRPBCC family protein n=1 Tax=Paenibacillus radicis (ex Xue et al. 2023) TaxID=2972489 RepID=A0ABT1YCN1_9BACL|nr:SRPBCC family protein [Paenibacillus radicis (ex Xue et al. 2023)]MCR8630949.1 SRPBCC family protein [Paenibacillus radicis (ex Xue et al. 2023)]
MNNLTKMEIRKPAFDVFEAFVDPEKIGNFWFSSSSERWEKGKTVTLRYEEYKAQGDIHVIEMIENRKIVFEWGAEDGEPHLVTITLKDTNQANTIVEVNGDGFDENDPDLIAKLVDNKEGWVYMLTCLKGYLEFGVNRLRSALVK